MTESAEGQKKSRLDKIVDSARRSAGDDPKRNLAVDAYEIQARNYLERLNDVASGKKKEGEHKPGALAVTAEKSVEGLIGIIQKNNKNTQT